MVRSVVRSPRVWATLAGLAVAIALLVLVEPLRSAVHVALNGLRERPIELIEPRAAPQPTSMPVEPDQLPGGTFVVSGMEEPGAYENPTAVLPLRPLTVDPRPTFEPPGSAAVVTRGARSRPLLHVNPHFAALCSE